MQVIEAKAAGKPSRRQVPKAAARTNVVDLMDRLRESLAATRKASKTPAARSPAARKTSARRKTARKTAARRGHAA
jgi:non-homologous end joining protein Ku